MSKTRTRESKNQRVLWLLLGLTVLLFGLTAFALMPAKQTYTVSPETTVAVGPLDAEGYVDNVTALNERLRGNITPERNANIVIWQAIGPHPEGGNMPAEYFEWLGRPAPPEEGQYLVDWIKFVKSRRPKDDPDFHNEVQAQQERCDRARKWPWKADDEPELAAWLERNARPLDKFAEASKLTEYYNPLVPHRAPNGGSGSLIACLLPNVQVCRNAASLFGCRAMLRLGSGRTDDAWTDLITSHRLGRLLQRGGCLIEQLVGIAIESIALQGEAIFLSHAKLTRQQVDACMADLRGMPARARSADKVDLTERFCMLDIMQSLARSGSDAMKTLGLQSDGVGEEALTMGLFSRSTDWNVAMRTANTHYDRVITSMRIEDLPARMEKMAEFDAELKLLTADIKERVWTAVLLSATKRGELFGNLIVALMTPAVSKIMAAEERTAQENDHLIIAFALKARHLDTGDFPAKLEDLAPKYLPKIPIDRFAAAALKYERRDNGYRLYSVGSNRMDENGNGREGSPPGDDLAITMPAIEPPPVLLPLGPVPPDPVVD